MRLTVVATSRFRRDFRRAVKRGLDTKIFEEIVDMIARGETLPQKNKDHELSGNFRGYRRVSYTE